LLNIDCFLKQYFVNIKMDELEILRFKISDKYEDDIYIHDIKKSENSIKIYFFPTFDEYSINQMKWQRIRQDISFIVKETFGYNYTTAFIKQMI